MNKALSPEHPQWATDDAYYLLKGIESRADWSQRSFAEELGYSLGKVNYLLKSLIDKGLVKAVRFAHNEHKKGYCYVLTPKGIEEKARITRAFLVRKEAEYERLRLEIERLRGELETMTDFLDGRGGT